MFLLSHFHSTLEFVKVTVLVLGEFLVATCLDDDALVDYKERLAVSDRTEAMCDDDRGSSFHGAVECLLNDFLVFFVEGGCGLVEDEEAGVADEGAGDGDALFLAAGEVRAFEAAFFGEAGGEGDL